MGFFLSLFFCLQDFLNKCAFGHAFRHYSKLRCRSIRSACECESAFSAFPHADAFSFHSSKSALWACVRGSELSEYLDVPFPDRDSVAGSQPSCRTHFLGSLSHVLFTSLVSCAVVWLFPWLFSLLPVFVQG